MAGGPRLVGEHRPHVPLARVELGGRRRSRCIRGREHLAPRQLGRHGVSFDTAGLEGHHPVGFHGLNVRPGRQLGCGSRRQARHRGHADVVERGLEGAAQPFDALHEVGRHLLGREHHDMATGLLLRQFGLHGKLGTIGRDGPRLI